MDLAAQHLCHALSPTRWGFPAVSNERSPTNKGKERKGKEIFIWQSIHKLVVFTIQ